MTVKVGNQTVRNVVRIDIEPGSVCNDGEGYYDVIDPRMTLLLRDGSSVEVDADDQAAITEEKEDAY